MNPIIFSRPMGAAIAVFAIALAGAVVAPASVAHAATAWTCSVDTFVWRSDTLNQTVVTSGAPSPTAGPLLVSASASATMTNLNAIALHPLTGVVYANNVGSAVGENVRVINPDGTVEDASVDVPFTNGTRTGYAGGTFTPDGHWLLADASGNFATVDLTNPASPTYGEVVYQGVILDSVSPRVASRWLSGDMAYRTSDDRVYFTTWGATIQVRSLPWSAFFGTADVVPDLGPTVTVPGVVTNSGAASGFDSAGNLWVSTNITNPATVPRQQYMFKLDAAALTGGGPITPTNSVSLGSGSGTDGFMCLASATPATLAAPPQAAGAPASAALAVTGPASDKMPIVGGGVAALLLGVALMIFAGARRGEAQ